MKSREEQLNNLMDKYLARGKLIDKLEAENKKLRELCAESYEDQTGQENFDEWFAEVMEHKNG